MLGKILSLFASVILLVGCSSNAPDIRAICLRDDIGNYVIKWETDPVMEGIVKMTVSDNPDLFTNESPIIYANIKDGVATYITNDNISRKYFRLSFNDKYPRIIGARSAVMDSVQNFRDLGGYTSTNGKTVKWGKVFRSGELSSLSEWDSIRLDNLGIKTIIDLRTNQETLPPLSNIRKQISCKSPSRSARSPMPPNVLSRDECGKETPGYIWKTSTCNS